MNKLQAATRRGFSFITSPPSVLCDSSCVVDSSWFLGFWICSLVLGLTPGSDLPSASCFFVLQYLYLCTFSTTDWSYADIIMEITRAVIGSLFNPV